MSPELHASLVSVQKRLAMCEKSLAALQLERLQILRACDHVSPSGESLVTNQVYCSLCFAPVYDRGGQSGAMDSRLFEG